MAKIAGEEFVAAEEPQQGPRSADAMRGELAAVAKAGKAMNELFKRLGSSRELSIARQRIEEGVLWATKHISNTARR